MGIISRRRLILSYTIQQVIPNFCTKFQNPRFSSSWEIFDEKVYTHTHTNIVSEKTKTIYPQFTVKREIFASSNFRGISRSVSIREN